jgi:hypothetical protein
VSGSLSNSFALLQEVIEGFFLKASNLVRRELGFRGVFGIFGIFGIFGLFGLSNGIPTAWTFVVSPVTVIPVFVATLTTVTAVAAVTISAPLPLPVSLAVPIPQLLLPFLLLLSLKLPPSLPLSSSLLLFSLKPLLFFLPLSPL